MKKTTDYAIFLSILILLFLGIYWYFRFGGLGMRNSDALSDFSSDGITADELNKILPTLDSAGKENLSKQEKARILQSLSAPQ